MNNKKGMLVSIIFLMWFFGSIFGIIYLSEINGYYSIMVFGQLFLIFGIIAFCNSKEKLITIPFILIGLSCIVIPYLMMNPEAINVTINWDSVIPLLFVSVFVLVGLGLIVVPILKRKKMKNICNMEVHATIVDNAVRYNDGTKLYCPIYEFEFNGQKYSVMNNQYKNIGLNPIGTIVTLKINPDDPNQFLSSNLSTLVFLIIMGIIFLAVSVPALVIVIQNGGFVK